MERRKGSSGQALLIILLVLSVALTTGLALVARTTTDISISEKETASSKAFEAAEAGVEEALKAIEAGQSLPSSLTLEPGGERAEVTIGQSEAVGNLAQWKIFPGQAATIWLNKISLDGQDFPADDIEYNNNSINLCWTGADNLEAAVYYQQGSSYKVDRYYLEGGAGCQGLAKGATINSLPEGKKFINVRFYSTNPSDQATIAVDNSLPRQGTVVESEAKVGEVVRKVSVFQGWPTVPQFFDFAVLSAGSLTKSD
ncbi:hypothetical protein KBI33_03850 [Candidatus Shapirobacteria bacterium]|nr:hypothetical protein [Candidatus Shapirobacteria bacterium]